MASIERHTAGLAFSRRTFLAAAALLALVRAAADAQEGGSGVRESTRLQPSTRGPDLAQALHDYNAFNAAVRVQYAARGVSEIRQEWRWDRVMPALHSNLLKRAEHFAALDERTQVEVVIRLHSFILKKREERSSLVIAGQGQRIVRLSHPPELVRVPETGAVLGKFEFGRYDYARAYGAVVEDFRANVGGRSAAKTARDFLSVVQRHALAGTPVTIIADTHGTGEFLAVDSAGDPLGISFKSLAAAMLGLNDEERSSQTWRHGLQQRRTVDLSKMLLIFDACFAADFTDNLIDYLQRTAARQKMDFTLPAAFVASASRQKAARGPLFERALTEYFVRWTLFAKERHADDPPSISLLSMLNFVDRHLYTYGRAPVFGRDEKIIGWRVVDADSLQDPIIVISLSTGERRELHRILRLPEEAQAPATIDIG